MNTINHNNGNNGNIIPFRIYKCINNICNTYINLSD